jgi:hypothetical protein
LSLTDLVLNLSNPAEKGLILDKIRGLQGLHRLTVVQYRRRRTDRQNRYYWPCFVQPLSDFFLAQGDPISPDDAHQILKQQFLRTSRVNKQTGEMVEFTRSTTDLDAKEFNDYLDRCAAFLWNFAGIQVPDPTVYHEQPEEQSQ